MAQNKDLVADAQRLLEENLSEAKSVESARRLVIPVQSQQVTKLLVCWSSVLDTITLA